MAREISSAVIHDWMVRLGIDGNELLIYAVIYKGSSEGKEKFPAPLSYWRRRWLLTSFKAHRALARLVFLDLIRSEKVMVKNTSKTFRIVDAYWTTDKRQ